MSTPKYYSGNFYKYNTNQPTNEILFHLRNIMNKEGKIIKKHILLPIGNYKDLIGELSPNHEISFITEVSLEELKGEILDQFEIISLGKN